MTLNQLTVLTVDDILMGEEPELLTIHVIPDEPVTSEKGCYHDFHGVINFNKEDDVDRKDE